MNTKNMHPHEIIQSRLKAMGINKIEVTHFRRDYLSDFYGKDILHPASEFRKQNLQKAMLPNGGSTVVSAEYKGNIYEGRAECSNQDHFNRRQGLTIALRRLYKKIVAAK